MTEDDWDLVMDVHLKGPFNMTKAAQKHFVEQKYGKILNLSSVSALGNRGQANYSAAKMGVQGFTRTLGIELGPFGINANAIAPGFIATEMTDATAARVKMSVEDFRAAPPSPTRSGGSGSPRTSPPPRRSSAATRRRTSRVRRCTSTAAPSSAEPPAERLPTPGVTGVTLVTPPARFRAERRRDDPGGVSAGWTLARGCLRSSTVTSSCTVRSSSTTQ